MEHTKQSNVIWSIWTVCIVSDLKLWVWFFTNQSAWLWCKLAQGYARARVWQCAAGCLAIGPTRHHSMISTRIETHSAQGCRRQPKVSASNMSSKPAWLMCFSSSSLLYRRPGAVFAARCYALMHKRGLCRRAVSVCLSVTFVYSVKTSIVISSNFSHHRLATPFYLFVATILQYSDGDTHTGASNKGVWNK